MICPPLNAMAVDVSGWAQSVFLYSGRRRLLARDVITLVMLGLGMIVLQELSRGLKERPKAPSDLGRWPLSERRCALPL